jgi:hypothetical protein
VSDAFMIAVFGCLNYGCNEIQIEEAKVDEYERCGMSTKIYTLYICAFIQPIHLISLSRAILSSR